MSHEDIKTICDAAQALALIIGAFAVSYAFVRYVMGGD